MGDKWERNVGLGFETRLRLNLGVLPERRRAPFDLTILREGTRKTAQLTKEDLLSLQQAIKWALAEYAPYE